MINHSQTFAFGFFTALLEDTKRHARVRSAVQEARADE